MRHVPVSLALAFIALCDLAVSTVFYCRGADFDRTFSTAIASYKFYVSVFDVWTLAVLRCSIVLGITIAVLCAPHLSVVRIKCSKSISLVIAACLCMLILVKLLAVSESDDVLHDKWFWMLFTWSLVTSALLVPQWILLGNIHISCKRSLNLNVNGDSNETGCDDTEPLVHTECGCEQKHNRDDGKNAGSEKLSRGTILRLVSYSRPDVLLIVTGFIFLIVSSVGEIFVPFYTGRVVDGIVIDKSQQEFTDAIVTMTLISLGSAVAAGIRGGCLFMAIRRLNIRIRNRLFASILRQEIGFFDATQTGDITSRLTSDTTTISDALGLNVNIFLRNMIKAIGVIFFMFKLSWRLSVVTVIGLPVVLAVSKIYGKYYEKLAEQIQDSLAEVNSVAEEACSTMRTVRSFANEDGEIQRYAGKLVGTYSLYKKQGIIYSGFVWCTRSFELALTAAVLYYGGHLVMSGRLTGGKLISFILYQIQLGDCVDGMSNVYTGLMQAAGASHKVFEYMDRVPRITHDGTLAPPSIQGHVEFRGVTFSYPTRPDSIILKDVSFSVAPGELVALVGPSGGGKTSCINLLENFYTSDAGLVLLDSTPIQHYDHHFLHRQVSLVGQEPVLYARTVEENIHYGLGVDEWTTEGVREAARLACAQGFISEMQDGYSTQAGEKGIQLSGGQKQRIAIARALLRKPAVLLLDEATSALDSESEYVVQRALQQNLAGRTVIVIAHRLSTVERADRIIVIDHGRVVDQGCHQELLQRPGLYASLVKRQLLKSDTVPPH